jgi:spore germination protein GerM
MAKKVMKTWKVVTAGIVTAAVVFGAARFYTISGQNVKQGEEIVQEKTSDVSTQVKQDVNKAKKIRVRKNFVYVTFLGSNKKGQEVYEIVKRPCPAGKKPGITFAVQSLLAGPNFRESTKGIYSEIPSDVKLISIEETPTKVVINLSDAFENGGGTNGIYERLNQLIKTANRNTEKAVYLNINGKQVDVIGGDGIMVTQPLNSKSLEN